MTSAGFCAQKAGPAGPKQPGRKVTPGLAAWPAWVPCPAVVGTTCTSTRHVQSTFHVFVYSGCPYRPSCPLQPAADPSKAKWVRGFTLVLTLALTMVLTLRRGIFRAASIQLAKLICR